MKTRQDVIRWAEQQPTLSAAKRQAMRIAVAALVFNRRGEVLLHCRGEAAADEVGSLEGIGGSLDDSEQVLESALARELREEIKNQRVGSNDPCQFVIDDFLACSHLTFMNRRGELKDWAVVTFLCRLVSGEPGVGEIGHTTGVGWFNLADLMIWSANDRRTVTLVDHDGNRFDKEVGLSIWVPTVVAEYMKKHGPLPWSGHRL